MTDLLARLFGFTIDSPQLNSTAHAPARAFTKFSYGDEIAFLSRASAAQTSSLGRYVPLATRSVRISTAFFVTWFVPVSMAWFVTVSMAWFVTVSMAWFIIAFTAILTYRNRKPAERGTDDRADYSLDCSFLPQCKHQVFRFYT